LNSGRMLQLQSLIQHFHQFPFGVIHLGYLP
jgi:hypothetical protein